MGPQADEVRIQVSITDERLFTHNIFSAVFIKLRKFMIKDGVHTENTEGYGCPQADEVGEQQLSKIGQQLKEKNIYPRMTRRDTEDDY